MKSSANLKIKAVDKTSLTDGLGTYKRWFNGMKHFYTVKSLPPVKKK